MRPVIGATSLLRYLRPFRPVKFVRNYSDVSTVTGINETKTDTEKKNDELISNLKYFGKPATEYKLLIDEVKNENDLKLAYDEYLKIIEDRESKGLLTCRDCGIGPLQSKDPSLPTYFKIPKGSFRIPNFRNLDTMDTNLGLPKEVKDELVRDIELKKKYQRINEGLEEDFDEEVVGDESKKVLSEYDVLIERQKKTLSKIAPMNYDCTRCKELKSHGVFNIESQNIDEILKKVPDNAHIVNIVSIFDFPLSCSRKILANGRDPKSIYYIVTKADLFFRKESQISKTGLQYVKDVLKSYMDADPEKVFFVSASKSWDVKSTMSKLPPGKLYFIGRANAGKSSLIKSMIASHHGIDINNPLVKKIEKKNLKYLDNFGIQSPGVFHIPGYTRDFQKFQIGEKFTVVDTPGFIEKFPSIYDYMTDDLIRQKPKYPLFVPEDRRRITKLAVKGPKLFSGDALYSYGGFFYLQPPQGVIMRSCVAFSKGERKFEARYRNWTRCKAINLERPEQIGNRFGAKPETIDNLERYVIPPFYGNIDLVVQDYGFLTISPTSSPNNVDGLFQIWIPKGIRVIVRESIFRFMYKTHGVVDETGNKLTKANIAKRGRTVLNSILDENKLHFTELIPVEKHLTNKQAFLKVCPEKDMVKLGDNPRFLSQCDYKNQYWRKLDL